MPINRWTGSAWANIKAVKRWNGSAWVNMKVKRWNGSAWVDLIQYEFTDSYTPSTAQNYWNFSGGVKDNQFPSEHIHGSYGDGDGRTATENLRRALIIFPYSTIASALSGATITGVRLRLQRLNTVHGSSGDATVVINSHNISSIPTTWSGTGLTQRATGAFARGEELWVTLPNAVGEGIRDGTIKGLALSTTNTSITYYARMDASRTLLEITYEK